MSCPPDWPSWISAISTAITMIAVIISALISRLLLKIEKDYAVQKKPIVYIWPNIHRDDGTFTLINVGGSPLSIRSIQLLDGSPEKKNIPISQAKFKNNGPPSPAQIINSYYLEDLILVPNQIMNIYINKITQITFKITYFDNTVELILIDLENSKAPYTITGKGKQQ